MMPDFIFLLDFFCVSPEGKCLHSFHTGKVSNDRLAAANLFMNSTFNVVCPVLMAQDCREDCSTRCVS